jgi:transposase
LLAATTAFGKTVLAIRMMAERGFLDESISALALFGGVLLSVLSDNLKIAVARSVAGKQERTRAFTELVSHYLFNERFGRPGKGPERLPV